MLILGLIQPFGSDSIFSKHRRSRFCAAVWDAPRSRTLQTRATQTGNRRGVLI